MKKTNVKSYMNSNPLGACIGSVLMMYLKICYVLMMTMLCCNGSCFLLGRAIIVLLHGIIIFSIFHTYESNWHLSIDCICLNPSSFVGVI